MKTITEEVEKIRAVRRSISSCFGNDPYRLVEHYVARAKKAQPGYHKKESSTQTHRIQESPKS
jgi:hypothetical protein